MKLYFISFEGLPVTCTVMALNEGQAWLKAIEMLGVQDARGSVELMTVKQYRGLK